MIKASKIKCDKCKRIYNYLQRSKDKFYNLDRLDMFITFEKGRYIPTSAGEFLLIGIDYYNM